MSIGRHWRAMRRALFQVQVKISSVKNNASPAAQRHWWFVMVPLASAAAGSVLLVERVIAGQIEAPYGLAGLLAALLMVGVIAVTGVYRLEQENEKHRYARIAKTVLGDNETREMLARLFEVCDTVLSREELSESIAEHARIMREADVRSPQFKHSARVLFDTRPGNLPSVVLKLSHELEEPLTAQSSLTRGHQEEKALEAP